MATIKNSSDWSKVPKRAPAIILRKHYAGELSETFWIAVHSLPIKDRAVLYALGCALQDLEARVLHEYHDRLLRASEKKKSQNRKQKQ